MTTLLEISPGSPDALMELANYVSTKFLQHRTHLKSVDWEKVFRDIEAQYAQVLSEVGFDMVECHEICLRKDTKQQEEPDEEEIDERVPHLLNTLGKALAAFAVGQKSDSEAASETSGSKANGKQKTKKKARPATGPSSPHFVHAVEVLRAAHHFHDKLGCYPLAWLYAYPGIEDEEVGAGLSARACYRCVLLRISPDLLYDVIGWRRTAGCGSRRPRATACWTTSCSSRTFARCTRRTGSRSSLRPPRRSTKTTWKGRKKMMMPQPVATTRRSEVTMP